MEFIVKRTNELSGEQIAQICDLFFNVFGKKKEISDFKRQFLKTCKGYSYHSMLIDNRKIVGCYSIIPYKYMYFGNEMIFGLSVDTMIEKDYRGNPFRFKKSANLIYKEVEVDNIPFVFGFPNDNIYLVRKKILKWKDITTLDFYILPVNIGKLVPILRPLNYFFRMIISTLNGIYKSNITSGNNYNIIKKNDDLFIKSRYDDTYNIEPLGDCSYFVYKIYNENNIKTAYIIDVFPLNRKNMQKAVKEIYKAERKKIDVIIYVGKLDFFILNLFKVPKKYSPKNIYMAGKILDNNVIDEKVFNINNWSINLSNYDVR